MERSETTATFIFFTDIYLDDNLVLNAREMTRCINPETGKVEVLSGENLKFPLVQVSAEDLAKFRSLDISAFVLKDDGKLYYSQIPYNMSLYSSCFLGTHMCSNAMRECSRSFSGSDKLGGCAKFRAHSTCIENFPWIIKGYETFNTRHDCFVVISCSHYEEPLPRISRSKIDSKASLLD